MKRHVQYPGVRKWSGDDLIELQSEGLLVEDSFFSQYGNCVITGCNVSEDGISSGLVSIGGMVMPFEAVTGMAIFPVYLVKDEKHVRREYADDVVRDVTVEYYARMVQVKPEGDFVEVTATGVSRFFDNMRATWLTDILGRLARLNTDAVELTDIRGTATREQLDKILAAYGNERPLFARLASKPDILFPVMDIGVTASEVTLWMVRAREGEITHVRLVFDRDTLEYTDYRATAVLTELVRDNLGSSDTECPLSANMGRVLDAIKADKTDLSAVEAIARGKARARVFDTVAALDEWLAAEGNAAGLQVGDNLYIKATDVPDYWWDGETRQPLEGEKVDLDPFMRTEDADAKYIAPRNMGDLDTLTGMPTDRYSLRYAYTSSPAIGISFAATPKEGDEYMIDILNDTASEIAQPIPNASPWQSDAASVPLPPGKVTSISVRFVHGRYCVKV